MMQFMTWQQLFGSVHVQTTRRRPLKTLDKAEWRTLEEDTMFQGIMYAKGSKFKVFETKNFGWVVFATGTRTPTGNVPGRLVHQY
jgi:hypothetical protein